jgi:hypothetical protein
MDPPSSTDKVFGRTVLISKAATSPTSRQKKIPTFWKLILKIKHYVQGTVNDLSFDNLFLFLAARVCNEDSKKLSLSL